MKKRILSLILALVMIFALAACGGGAKDDANANANANANSNAASDKQETPKDDGKVYELTFSMHDPADSGIGPWHQAWIDEVAEKSNGRLKITLYGSATLATGPDVADMVEGGGADIGWVFTGFYAEQYPLSDVCGLVMEGFESCEATTNALWDLYEQTPEMQAEWADYQLLALYANPRNVIMTKGKKVESLADMKGLSLRTPAGQISTALTTWGASPIGMPPNDIYQALEKNNINGVVWESAGTVAFNVQEQLDYYCNTPIFQGTFACVMNKDKFNSLPEDLQQVLIDTGIGREWSVATAIDFDERAAAAEKIIADAGVEFYELDAAVVEEMKAAIKGQAEAWGEAHSVGSLNGVDFVNLARQTVAKYNK